MWMKNIPAELQGLTFPKQLLLALLYPCIYVFKLFPKKVDAKWDANTLQRGMHGNVTTFELDNPSIVLMLKERLMPQPPAILASIITVTFVGLRNLPKSWLQKTFRIRRDVAATALQWLKQWNLRYYGNMNIDKEQLAALPEDDVPEEIMNVV
ncbi:Methionine aminopeptidase 1 [Marasmius crinis-equi]|uniref:Methionine aminopeptidase 1 n=1 Tax=Marasmius crinis-equi TaxID=585013 RepID=A0ABR3F502_9AGAR